MNENPPPLEPLPLPPPPAPVPSLTPSGLASLVAVLGFMGFLTIGSLTQLASVPFGLWWTELFVFFGIPFVALRLAGNHPAWSTGFTQPWVAGCAFGFALGFANFFAVVAPIQFIATKIAPKDLIEAYDASKIFLDKSTLEIAVIVAGVCIAAPLGEEFFFRGVLQRGWAKAMGPVVAIVFTGAVFSAFHLDPVGFPARWELGVLFGLLAWRTGSVWPGIFAHLANNLTSTVLYFAFKDEPQDPSEDVTAVLAIAGIGGLVLLLVFYVGLRIPGTLTSPEPARDENVPAARPSLAAQWFLAGIAAIAVLLTVDFRGSVLRGIDLVVTVKKPTSELKATREAARKGEVGFADYFKARQHAGPADAGH